MRYSIVTSDAQDRKTSMIKELFQGAAYLRTGISLLTQPGIRRFVLVPLLINIVLFAGGTWLAITQLDYWMGHLLPSWLLWLEWLLWPIFAFLLFFLVFYAFTVIANLIAAPFNSILAEKIEARLNGLPIPEFEGYSSIPGLLARTFKSELSKLWYMSKWYLVMLIFTFIPGLNIISPFAWALFGAWMLALEYADYPMGNHNLFFQQQKTTLKKHVPTALGFGGVLSLMTVVPGLNFFAMPIGVAGATVFWVNKLAKTI